MSKRNTFPLETLEQTLKQIADKLTDETDIYLIGGGAMTYYETKVATKDIDIVFLTKGHLLEFIRAAKQAGLTENNEPEEEYTNIGTWTILTAESGVQLDLFYRVVCNALEVKDTVVSRTKHHKDMGRLHLHLMSPEDIVLFKGITERESDLEDMRTLAEAGIDWNTVEEECLSQENSETWANLLLTNLYELRNRYGINPRLDRLREHADSYVLRKSFETFLGDNELSFPELQKIVEEKTGYSPTWTRNKLKELEAAGFIKTRMDGRRKKYRI